MDRNHSRAVEHGRLMSCVGVNLASGATARQNIKKAAKAPKRKRTVAHLSKQNGTWERGCEGCGEEAASWALELNSTLWRSLCTLPQGPRTHKGEHAWLPIG